MEEQRRPFLDLDLTEARAAVAAAGGAPVHAERLRRRILAGGEPGAEGHGGYRLPRRLLAALEERFLWSTVAGLRRVTSPDGADKHLLRLADGQTVECLRLPGSGAPSACLSTQVGCAVGCPFCASGLGGLRRNLRAHEILEQLAFLRRHGPVRRLVFMGAGEPTGNLRALARVLPVLRDEAGIGPRAILVSTVGPPAAIRRLTALGHKLTLALSLHAVDRELRGELVPTQAGVEPEDLLRAADDHVRATGRSYQVEYVLLAGVNDGRADARALARALRGRRAHVSLLSWNPVPGLPFARPSQARVRAFLEVLHEEGTSVTLRRTVGEEGQAACGQLRAGVAVG